MATSNTAEMSKIRPAIALPSQSQTQTTKLIPESNRMVTRVSNSGSTIYKNDDE